MEYVASRITFYLLHHGIHIVQSILQHFPCGEYNLHLTKDNLRSCIPSHCSYYSNERVIGVWHQLVLDGEGK